MHEKSYMAQNILFIYLSTDSGVHHAVLMALLFFGLN